MRQGLDADNGPAYCLGTGETTPAESPEAMTSQTSQPAMKEYRVEHDGRWVYNRLWWDGASTLAWFESGYGHIVLADMRAQGLTMVEGWA